MPSAMNIERGFHMSQFCPNCGTQVSEDGAFCPNCGTKIAPAAPQPVQQPAPQPMQQPVQQYMPQPVPQAAGSFLDNMAQKFNLSKNVLLGIAGGVLALIVVLILVLSLSGGPSVIKDYKYKDICGTYDGEAEVGRIKFDYSYDKSALEDLADEMGMDVDEIEDMLDEYMEEGKQEADEMEGQTMECSIEVTKDEIEIKMEEYVFLDTRYCTLEDAEFDKGVAKGEVEIDDGVVVEYKLYLQEAESKKADYRITGTIKVSAEVEEDGAAIEYSCTFDVDVEY